MEKRRVLCVIRPTVPRGDVPEICRIVRAAPGAAAASVPLHVLHVSKVIRSDLI
jgi:hypothetical protein